MSSLTKALFPDMVRPGVFWGAVMSRCAFICLSWPYFVKGGLRGRRAPSTPAIACGLVATILGGGEAAALSVPDPATRVLEISISAGGDFPGDLYADFDWLDMYAISECGPCGDAKFDLFDPDLGELVSVDVAYEGELWLDGVNRFYYGDMSLVLGAGSWGDGPGSYFSADISDLVKTDGGWEASEANFSGSFSVPENQLDAFVMRERRPSGVVGFSGTPQVDFWTKESAYYALGGDYSMTIRYGYEPAVAPVPLPPAAALALGSLGALVAASRRRRLRASAP